ncbi:MAG: hypothetical protein JW902_17530 [Syntrophaceae bacterium]|nr:hypothetical protein [Syntrophaceae bacterium]
MKRTFVVTAAFALMVMMFMGCAQGNKTEATTEYPGIVKGMLAVATATVADIDLGKRIVTLENEEGDVRDFKVGEEVVNLPQVKVGDIVTVKFYESIAVEVVKPGTATGAGENTTIVRAKPGEMPAGMVTHQKKVLATVKAIDEPAGTVSLTGPAGKTVKVKVEDPSNLGKIKVGDELLITFTEAQAISVDRAK